MATFQQIHLLYRLRWQIELLFKFCKSHLKLARVTGFSPTFLLCQLYVRLILLVLLCHWIAPLRLDPSRETSLTKAFQVFSNFADRLVWAMTHHPRRLASLIQRIQLALRRFSFKQKRLTNPSTLDSLLLVCP